MFSSIDWGQPLVFVNVLFVIGFLLSGLPVMLRASGPGQQRIVPAYRAPAVLMMAAHCALLILSKDSRPVQSLAVLCGIYGLLLLCAELRALRNPFEARLIAVCGIGSLAAITLLLVAHAWALPDRYFDRVMVGLIIGASGCWLIFNEAMNLADERFGKYRIAVCALAIGVMYLILLRIHYSIQHSDLVLIQPYHEPLRVLWARLGVGCGVLMILGLLNAYYLETLIARSRAAATARAIGSERERMASSRLIVLR